MDYTDAELEAMSKADLIAKFKALRYVSLLQEAQGCFLKHQLATIHLMKERSSMKTLTCATQYRIQVQGQ